MTLSPGQHKPEFLPREEESYQKKKHWEKGKMLEINPNPTKYPRYFL